MRITCAFLAILVLHLSGCTVFNPYVAVPSLETSNASTPSAATLDEALVFLDKAQDRLEYNATEQAVIAGGAGVATFIGLAGAGVSAIFQGSRDLILGLATGGALSYGIHTLYGNSVSQRIYRAGLVALGCVDDAVRPIAATLHILGKQEAVLDAARTAVETRRIELGESIAEEQRLRLHDALHRAAAATQLVALARAREPATAAAVYGAVSRIFTEINNQIMSVRPDAAAIASVASGISTMAQTFYGQAMTLRPTIPPLVERTLIKPDEQMTRALDLLDKAIAAIEETLSGYTGITAPQLTACAVADQTKTTALSVDAPTPIEMKYNETQAFTISGGTLPYRASWVGVIPIDIEFILEHPYNLKIRTKEGITQDKFRVGQKYSLQVFDNTPGIPKRLATPLLVVTK